MNSCVRVNFLEMYVSECYIYIYRIHANWVVGGECAALLIIVLLGVLLLLCSE